MAKQKKDKMKKSKSNVKPAAHNDQLGENASEAMRDAYDNKNRK